VKRQDEDYDEQVEESLQDEVSYFNMKHRGYLVNLRNRKVFCNTMQVWSWWSGIVKLIYVSLTCMQTLEYFVTDHAPTCKYFLE